MRKAYRAALEHQLAARPDEYAILKLMGPVIDAVQAVVEHKCSARSAERFADPRHRPIPSVASSNLGTP
jgi:hypothetical protein